MKMESPIEFLLRYVTDRFEHTNDSFSSNVQSMFANGQVDSKISLTCAFDSPKTIFGKIILNKPFMNALWCFCYYYYVLHEHYVVPYYNEGVKAKTPVLDQAEQLFEWGCSLQNELTKWPKDLPMPIQYEDNTDVHMANQIFLYAMNFILCHEFAHIEKAPQRGTPIEMENEADDTAFDMLLKGCDGQNDTTIYLGILMAFACLLLLNPRVEDSETHPSSISRLDRFVRKIDLSEDHTLWCIITIILHGWNMRFKLDYDFPKESETFQSLYNEMIAMVRGKCANE